MNRLFSAALVALALVSCDGADSGAKRTGAAGGALQGSLAGRHVVLLVLDSLHAAHLSSYGCERPTSPHIDRIAANGVRFADTHSQTSWTLSSAISILTSVPQEEHGVKYVEDVLTEEFELLPTLFADAGYRTAALSQNGCVRPVVGLGRASDSFKMFPRGEEGTRAMFDRILELIEGKPEEGSSPAFVYAHVLPPHMPYFPPEGHAGLFSDPNYEGPVDGDFMACLELTRNKTPVDHPDAIQLVALYDEYIHWIDEEVGRFRAELASRFGEDSFAIVLTSDHGEAFQQHGKQGHNADVYQEMVHVPLVFEAPNSDLQPHVSAEPV
ncbi:MAG: sulfatase-like hydrolase/transferase, partial [Planctomycetota bacterium]